MIAEAPLLATSDYSSDDAIFQNIEQALRFALRRGVLSPSKDSVGSLSLRAGSGSLGRDEIPGQAGMILNALKDLSDPAKAILNAKFAPKSVVCGCQRACCSGYIVGRSWQSARAFLIDASTEAFAGKMIHYRLRDGLIRKWAGEKNDIGRLADACGVNRNTVGAHHKIMKDWLQKRLIQAMAQAQSLLEHQGIDYEELVENE